MEVEGGVNPLGNTVSMPGVSFRVGKPSVDGCGPSALSTTSVCRVSRMAQPTTFLENKSSTTARYSQPSVVGK